MKFLALLTLVAGAAYAQCGAYANFNTIGPDSPNLIGAMNAKLNIQCGTTAPTTLGGTAGVDAYINTSNGNFYICTVTGTPCGSGGSGWILQTGGSVVNACAVTQPTATTLSIAAGASASSPCQWRYGTQTWSVVAPVIITWSAGTGTIYVYGDSSGGLDVAIGTMTISCATGCTTNTGTGFPVTLVQPTPIWIWTVNSSGFISGGGTQQYSIGTSVYSVTGAIVSSVTTTATGTTWGLTVPHSIDSNFYKNGAALTNGMVNYKTIPFSCTLSNWAMTVDTGTATIDIWKIATGTAIPVAGNSITASATPAVASGTAATAATSAFSTQTVTKGDIFGFEIKATSGPTVASISLECDQ